MAAPVSAQLPDELLMDIFIQSISEYGLIDDFLDSIARQRLTLPLHTQISSLEEWKRRTQTLLYLSRVSNSWFRVATPLLYEVIRIYRPTMVFALLRASSEAPVLLEHIKHLRFDIDHSEDSLKTDESNPDVSHAFKELASRCPNLRVLRNHSLESNDDQHTNLFPSLRLYEGLLHPLVSTTQTTLQYLILQDNGTPFYHNLQGLSLPLLHVLDLTRTDPINYPIILSWEMPVLRELRGRFNRQRVSYDIIAKAAKTLHRLQIQISMLDESDSWGISRSDVDARIPLPHLREVIVCVDDGVSVGLHPRYFLAFCSLGSLRLITMSIPKTLKAFIMTLVSFVRIFDDPVTSQTPKHLTVQIGEASLKPQMNEWSELYNVTMRSLVSHMVHRFSDCGVNVLFAMPDGTYDTLHWFNFEYFKHR